MGRIAAVTMVRDDAFFLDIWLRHYGGLLGRENCYVVNHGRGAGVAQQAAGCNIIGIPGDPHPNFDMKRWRVLNNIGMGLRSYYDHVIVGDVDDIVIIDPDDGTVKARIDLTGLLPAAERERTTDVLNGIAHDAATGNIWVTGKRWPWLYRIEVSPSAGDSR